ncbi:hypothetical protein GUITHDRAFT_162029 [Guillardia theta CCMP2712]|uniref:Uncharacterized protein n=2 Tax=Guillardia theta TaxID=55529 RepID=L1JNM8_GUITC|nr:hypothetical protein GUITHDRAFT_162029 [Guillardia theta CCMP2712]EKX50067.1 hypothetical protein GUITHDRAFT_162029 [Guillardia theta CCMP2712]|mmetsp:Transcript_38218/g.120344  ORF Transcript_38218/g.120344 Transcript_38218/m.120344 type:complete len:212 (+) Transcript_38218:315-950(+)|eukprot:XP_005837047.1 hypothetical protein GUITHDRAFT_162029 [Guillardia theta CCMP2712]
MPGSGNVWFVYRPFMLMCVLGIVLATVLFIVSVVLITLPLDDTCKIYTVTGCTISHHLLNTFVNVLAAWSSMPALFPITFGAIGLYAGTRGSRGGVMSVMFMSLIGMAICAIGASMTLYSRQIVCDGQNQTTLPTNYSQVCYFSSALFYVVVVLNGCLVLQQLVLSLLSGCFCCDPVGLAISRELAGTRGDVVPYAAPIAGTRVPMLRRSV